MGSLARLKKACHVFPAKAPRAFCEVSALPPLGKNPSEVSTCTALHFPVI